MFWWKKKKKTTEQQPAEPLPVTKDNCVLKVVVKTDVGNVRKNNEDSGTFVKIADEGINSSKGCMLLVADGMGGHNAGEVASKIAMETISEEYFKKNSDTDIEKALANSFVTANKKIFSMSQTDASYKGMGTTCTVLVVTGAQVYFAHAGDTRAYFLKNNQIKQITEDHTYVQQLVNNGDITAAEADVHPQRNVLINAMGTKPTLRVDTGKSDLTFNENDKLLLCSDGLHDYLSDDELAEAMQKKSLQEIADYLIDEAKRRGGKDNITVALAQKISTAPQTETKLTRDIELPGNNNDTSAMKLTRDVNLPNGI
ncbi:MAG: Stp1/IreP family PP2C-type Ser/Thr phosphatase [Ferruginibacter sp.]|nr:Stp1/IreP family PP2C-type Ser/Thr phosphatase [Bacteroidota bacterium]MBX2918321.1 Stp1/IreP family PP2C-type Ser/Thr phosphatase [Ferruginibacter sp.]MCB0709046.1 Stp1/IreP family PP2C-type Ser/Thr phosphatase [Chitinophagaceae bacterium]